ncbi:MAG: hypothetical protein LBQ41_02860 [Candidatus Ancillula sp.]|jgi:hypothetical protein|nr:hypothetical protein [Candidatus Ancillula sp.]
MIAVMSGRKDCMTEEIKDNVATSVPKDAVVPAEKPAESTLRPTRKDLKAAEGGQAKPDVSAQIKSLHRKAVTKTGLPIRQANVAFVIIALIVVALIIWGIVAIATGGTYTKGDIKKVELYQTKSTKEIETLKPQFDFKRGDPIILKFDYQTANQNGETKTYTYQVLGLDQKTQEGEPTVIRKGSIPVQPSPEDQTSTRYVSIVSSERTAIEPGKYAFELKTTNADGTEEVTARSEFTVIQ